MRSLWGQPLNRKWEVTRFMSLLGMASQMYCCFTDVFFPSPLFLPPCAPTPYAPTWFFLAHSPLKEKGLLGLCVSKNI